MPSSQSSALRNALATVNRIIVPLALLSTLYLYLYPVFHGCAFPSIQAYSYHSDGQDENNAKSRLDARRNPHNVPHTKAQVARSWWDTARLHVVPGEGGQVPRESVAPFRLLVLADPQIEGDSSLPKAKDGFTARLGRHVRTIWRGAREEKEERKATLPDERDEEILTDREDADGYIAETAEIVEGHVEPADQEPWQTTVETEPLRLEDHMTEPDSDSVPPVEESVRDAASGEDVLLQEPRGESLGDIIPTSEAVLSESTEAEDIPSTSDKADLEVPDVTVSESAVTLEAAETTEAPTEEEKTHDPELLTDRPPTRIALAIEALQTICLEDIPRALFALRKQIDLFGNDFYLAHIYRTLNWWTKPSHITVLGDLIGSQWVKDDEFDRRGWRYWNRVMAGGVRVEDSVTILEDQTQEQLFDITDPSWKKRIINIAGNHDIGYAGDISESRMARFERVFGAANWDVRFQYPAENAEPGDTELEHTAANDASPPSLHLINLNSLMLDTPALSEDIQTQTYEFMNQFINHRSRPVESNNSFTLLLTHVPLFKKAGVCVDAPHFDFWGNDDGGGVYRPRGLKEQNHLSRHASEPGILESIFGMKGDIAGPGQGKGRPGLILNGHDHEGCDTWHYVRVNRTWNSSDEEPSDRTTQWHVSKIAKADPDKTYTGVREITLRSMMGDFGGNAGLLSAWYDFDHQSWEYEFQTCKLGVQHVWWAVHIVDLAALASIACACFLGSDPEPKFASTRRKVDTSDRNGSTEKKD